MELNIYFKKGIDCLKFFKSKFLDFLKSLNSYQLLSLGFLSYLLVGVFFISLPFAQKQNMGFIDNLFNIVSAMSTTGLTTASISEVYSVFGLIVLLILMQLGGLGYMTISSFVILSRFNTISPNRFKILSIEFPLPDNMQITGFIKHIMIYTILIETFGTLVLWWEFSKLGLDTPLWSAFFHSISAFATAGFSLYPNGLEGFKDNVTVNAIISFLCYAGAIGFIVPLDIFRRITKQTTQITFTTKVILSITFSILAVATIFTYFTSNENLLVSFFQIMTASTTAGFNTVAIGSLPSCVLLMIMFVMVIGASPSGTGGGIKTTSISVLLGIIFSVLSGEKEKISFMGNTIPYNRVFTAVATTIVYLLFLFLVILLLSITETFSFLQLAFEASSALGTVGLSTGITGDLSPLGKLIITCAMFGGRVGLLALVLSVFVRKSKPNLRNHDLAV